ncbi:MAG TPA: alpha-L-arabinofuranosidase C-terminal domain-containing protein [Phycisphaerae bacterium]|nr:alpha-L-arabinofuranosidase C-terminal domain-containing protein [Phycisphaerae bacterium]HRY67215.1 alpha-L-arabinofuranosidase C-terminal domain-containing protein [Phycisphaerae bacterium]HSA26415.1 alpha-L-arabinofuranosidase C-terminal domain-containing protein [Phycisphaerae bacterium]
MTTRGPGRPTPIPISLIAALVASGNLLAQAGDVQVKVSSRPLHEGKVNPMLFGNFMEPLDDLIPGMWSEMLNDRGFEGVVRCANWVYYDGAANTCDRQWEPGDDWSLETAGAFNGPRCARITGRLDRPAGMAQPGLAVTKGATYHFAGHFRANAADTRVQVVIKAALAQGDWTELAAASLPPPGATWTRAAAQLISGGTTDRAVFEIRVTGKGTVWADKLSLMPAQNLKGWRTDVIGAIGAARPAVIRWGGSAIDPGGYRWKSGIGNRDQRVPFPNTIWGRIDSNDVGIDEFCQFCELVQAEPLICLSFSDGPQNAADLVQYCNGPADTEWGAKRAANGHPEPYRVKYWQLGNEISGEDDNYVAKCPAFFEAMKRADPSVRLLSSFPSQKVLDALGKSVAYIAPHHYTPDLGGCEADFNKLDRMIRNAPGCDHIRVAVTEWNFTAGDWGLMRGKMLTLEGALLNARYLNLLARYSDLVEIACRSNMANSSCSGIIGTSPAGLLKRPSYHVMKLYSEHAKPIPLAIGNLPDGLDGMACATLDRKAVCLFAVSLKNEPTELVLDLTEFGDAFTCLAMETVSDTLDARQPDVMNHWTAPGRVAATRTAVKGNKVTLPAFSAAAIECGKP